jgi:hypothetical protein
VNPNPSSYVDALATLGPAVYTGGRFNTFELAAQEGFAAFGQPGQEPEEVKEPEEPQAGGRTPSEQPASSSSNPPPPLAPMPEPPNTRLLQLRINAAHGAAMFVFGAHGTGSGFECALVRAVTRRGRHRRKARKQKPTFKSCESPKAYRGLKSGAYLFEVRASGPGGLDKSPARLKFTITRRTHR